MSLIKVSDQTNLVETSRFPHGKYPFEFFNQVQSRVFELYDKNCNCVIAAPTSVGKTICAEMFMSHEARVRGGKAIYLAPLRALAKEKIDDWLSEKSLFRDLKISICTGDYRLTEARMKELNEADLIVMTSEMLNSRCRNLQSEKNEFLRNCGTLVVDESHLLTVPSRGDHLEVGLMKFSQIARDPRIVFLSATMPNVDQIANWVGCSLVKKDTYLVHSEYRPCPLEIHYDEYETGESYDLTEEYKASSAVDLIKEHKDDKFLVFVHSKATGERIRSALEERGVVCELHNADLDKDKRHKVEQKFKSGDLRVIVATSTLAWGCYKHGTMILMSDGSKKDVADISVGDDLLCPIEKKSIKIIREKNFNSDCGYFVDLDGGESMVVSENHVFLSILGGGSPSWNEVFKLKVGDMVATFGGSNISDFKSGWLRVSTLEFCSGGVFKEIEVEAPHAYVGAGAISHNCNFPARRVIIAGVHRGRTEVETYDIFQMAGRAGRPGYDPKGDVHILLPYGESDHHIDRLSTPKNIESQLLSYVGQEEDPRYKTLAFHLVSEIHYGQIKTIKDVHDWYGKSLAYFQYEDLDDSIVDKTIDLLTRVGAIKEVDGNYEATSVGKVSSIMYYSPFDVADLRRNFRILFSKGLDQSDFALSLALGNVDTIRAGFVTRAEKDEMGDFASKVYEAHGSEFPESAIKGAYAYYCLLNGSQLGPFASFARGLQMDAERLISVLNMLDSMAAKWNRRDYFNAAHLRIMYGVRLELIELCKIPNIGKVRAEKLYAAGFRRPPDLFKNPHLVKRLLNMKDEKIQEIMNSIKSIS